MRRIRGKDLPTPGIRAGLGNAAIHKTASENKNVSGVQRFSLGSRSIEGKREDLSVIPRLPLYAQQYSKIHAKIRRRDGLGNLYKLLSGKTAVSEAHCRAHRGAEKEDEVYLPAYDSINEAPAGRLCVSGLVQPSRPHSKYREKHLMRRMPWCCRRRN